MQVKFIDNNTGEPIEAADGFAFVSVPEVGHRIQDPELKAHFGAFCIVKRVVVVDLEMTVYVDSTDEVRNDTVVER